jgi:hypothetical protein
MEMAARAGIEPVTGVLQDRTRPVSSGTEQSAGAQPDAQAGEGLADSVRCFHFLAKEQQSILLDLLLTKCPAAVADVFRLYVKVATNADA